MLLLLNEFLNSILNISEDDCMGCSCYCMCFWKWCKHIILFLGYLILQVVIPLTLTLQTVQADIK